MNPLIKKEIRLLLPSFLIGIPLTFANCFFVKGANVFNGIPFFASFVICPAIAVFMALNSFGAEFSAGTFSMLLAQPVTRSRVWRMKTLPLAAALFIGGFLWCAMFYLRAGPLKSPNDLRDIWDVILGVWLFLLSVYSGALWTVLLLRQVAAAFWFTLLVPGAILVVISALVGENHPEWFEPVAFVAMLIYGIAGFLFARRLFLRAQDVTWTGGTIAMPEMRGLPFWFSRSAVRRVFRPRAALWWKEIQLHQAQFIMAGALVLLHLGVVAERKFGSYQRNSSTEFILEIFWRLWLVMPMLVGAAAVAEERKLGTLAGQFSLPVKRRTQFAIKFLAAMLLSILFGAVMPLLLEGTRILPDFHLQPNPLTTIADFHAVYDRGAQTFFWMSVSLIMHWLPLLTLAGTAAVIGAISFYASTLTRNTLQALAPAVLGLLLMSFLFQPRGFDIHFPWNGLLFDLIGVPVFFIMVMALTFGNFKRVNVGVKTFLQNAFAFVATLAFVFVATTAIYHRAWEKLTPFEPPHGAARLTLSNPAKLSDQWDTYSLRLPDGKVWTGYLTLNTANPGALNPLDMFLGNIQMTLSGGHFLEGSNWVSVARSIGDERVGIKTDGTLWVSEKPARRERLANGQWTFTKAGKLVQFGSETNWSSVAPNGIAMLLVKDDGTLWRWGATNWNGKAEWPGLRSFTPQRLGADTNWSEVFLENGQIYFRKTDGTVWTYSNGNQEQQIQLEPGFSLGRVSSHQSGQWRSTTVVGNSSSAHVGVWNDGIFRVWAETKLINKKANSYEWTLTDVNQQLGTDTNWLGVAGRGEKVVTLKNDGSLWLWDFSPKNEHEWNPDIVEDEMLDAKPVRLGTHSDWIAIATAEGGIISLAADGSLWYWPLVSANEFMAEIYGNNGNNGGHFEPLLDNSRKPQLLGNIFSKAD